MFVVNVIVVVVADTPADAVFVVVDNAPKDAVVVVVAPPIVVVVDAWPVAAVVVVAVPPPGPNPPGGILGQIDGLTKSGVLGS